MDEQRYLINGRIFAADDPGLQEALARVHGTPARPRCLCVAEGVEMYVSKFSEFVIKRMPDTGDEHCPTCPSYELPAVNQVWATFWARPSSNAVRKASSCGSTFP